MNGHERLAQKILDEPIISSMLEQAGIDKSEVIHYCEWGDLKIAHDIMPGWEAFSNWAEYYRTCLIDAQGGTVKKWLPTSFKYPVVDYDDYDPEWITDGHWDNVTTITYNAHGQIVTTTSPVWVTTGRMQLTLTPAQHLGLLLHNLTDCAVPVGHYPARDVYPGEGNTELTFETDAGNDIIPGYSTPCCYQLERNEVIGIQGDLNNLSDNDYAIFWNAFKGKFYTDMISYATRLKSHVDGNNYNSTTSEWLSEDCFNACLKFSILVVYKFLENSEGYIYNTGKQPVNDATQYNVFAKQKDITPIISLLLLD